MAGVLTLLVTLTSGCADGGGEEPGVTVPPSRALSDPTRVAFPDPAPADPARARAAGRRDFAETKPPGVSVGCRKNAFCDDFEDGAPGARWTSSTATDGSVDFAGPSSSLGATALHASTLRSGAAGSAAYLTLAGPAVGTQWVGSLAFSILVDETPEVVLGGPEMAVAHADGTLTRVGFSIRPEGIALHQFAGACASPACASRSDIVTPLKPGEWRRLTVAIETAGSAGPSFGRIEVTVDGGDLIMLPLSVMPFDGAAEVHAGITVADSAPASARIDDVVFFTQ